MWAVSTTVVTKLYGRKQELEKTSFISRAALSVCISNVRVKKKTTCRGKKTREVFTLKEMTSTTTDSSLISEHILLTLESF